MHHDAMLEPAQLLDAIIIVILLRQVNSLLFGGQDAPLGVALLPSLAAAGHAECSIDGLELLDVGRKRVLDTLA